MTPDTPDDGLQAAEYVLRLLPPPEERRFEDRLMREQHLAAHVTFWANHFAGMNAEVKPVRPRAAVRRALMAQLFGPVETVPLWRRAGLWQALSLASLVLAGFVTWQSLQAPGTTAPLLISEIAAQDQSLRVLAVYHSGTDRLQITRTAGAAATGRVLELWAIAEGAAPVSLGVLPESQTATLALPDSLRGSVRSLTLAISDEPPGGSPTGAPTGAVLATGQVTTL